MFPYGHRKFNYRDFLLWGVLPVLLLIGWFGIPRINFTGEEPGMVLDSLDGVYAYNNGPVAAVYGRNATDDGYNVGLKYQCVEFVKRYYLEHFSHRMPDSYGHAKDFFQKGLSSGTLNESRGLIQYTNGMGPQPQRGDLVVFKASIFNPYGHVAIVASVDGQVVEIMQQNPGRKNATRRTIPLKREPDGYRMVDRRILGWLRMPPQDDNPDTQI